jgi:hypothetical protein
MTRCRSGLEGSKALRNSPPRGRLEESTAAGRRQHPWYYYYYTYDVANHETAAGADILTFADRGDQAQCTAHRRPCGRSAGRPRRACRPAAGARAAPSVRSMRRWWAPSLPTCGPEAHHLRPTCFGSFGRVILRRCHMCLTHSRFHRSLLIIYIYIYIYNDFQYKTYSYNKDFIQNLFEPKKVCVKPFLRKWWKCFGEHSMGNFWRKFFGKKF